MLALLHEAEGVDRLGDRPDAVGQGLELAVAHAPHDLPQQRAEEGRPLADHAVEIDGEEREVVAERLQAEPGVLVDVALADLEEAAVIGEEARPRGMASPGSELRITSTPRPPVRRAPRRRRRATASP